jgi:hypothetical protein
MDNINTARLASYIELYLEIDIEGRLRSILYDKWDDFIFPIANIYFIGSTILAASAYGIYISQWSRYCRTCGSYQDFIDKRDTATK